MPAREPLHESARPHGQGLARQVGVGLVAMMLAGAGACATQPDEPAPILDLAQFGEVLEMKGAPVSSRDLTAPAFSDRGAWHMFGLPPADVGEGLGGFTGPLLLTDDGVWLSRSLVRLHVEVGGRPVEWAAAGPGAVVSYPGSLRQTLSGRAPGGPALSAVLNLFFVSERSALVEAAVTTSTSGPVDVSVSWMGDTLLVPADVVSDRGGISVSPHGSETIVDVRFLPAPAEIRPGDSTVSYRTVSAERRLERRDTLVARALISAYFDKEERSGDEARRADLLSSGPAQRAAHRKRWDGYLAGALGSRMTGSEADAESRLAVKAVQTLLSNWRSPAGHLYHAGLFPSYAYRGFHGVWSWDSWKHARALALFAPELAKDQVRVMLDHQNERGMIPDVIYRDSTENNWRDTKPPLAAWAVHGIWERTQDTSFVAEVFPALHAYHRWWYADRDHDGDGLCEYGSTDGTLIAAAWESGMDNAVRFDSTTMVPNGPGAWSMDQESVDLNAYLYADKLYLADLADIVGQRDEGARLRQEAAELGRTIRASMYDERDGYFFDVGLFDGEPVRVQGPEGWIPLWAGVADSAQARRVAAVMMDPARFAGRVPLPTLSMARPEFDPTDGYWRGPVWLDQVYFGIQGLLRYGLVDDAEALREGLLQGAVGLLDDKPIFENYHPVTGEGLNAAHFSWSAAHLLLLLQASDLESGG